MNPEEIGDSRGGRGRGAGRGVGTGRGAGRGAGTVTGRVLPQIQPGRHSSYTPSDPTTSATPPPRGGSNFRPQSNYSESKTPLVQVDSNETDSPTPMPSVRGTGVGGRGSGRGGIAGSIPTFQATPLVPKNPLANTEPLPRRSLNFNQQPTPEPATNGRALPKFSEIKTVVDDEPTPPPRSPHVSPRLSNLPPLPPRAGGSAPDSPSVTPGSPAPASAATPDEESKRADMRHKVLEEIYTTERDYIEDLGILINVFIFPLRTMKILEENTLYSIFSNVEVLIGCNDQMYKELGESMHGTESGEFVQIGAIFTRLADYFKMYKVYCANQQNALGSVEMLMKKNSQFKKNLDVCHSDPRCRGLFLQSFLIKPIQRVCKYPLLLRELIRYTPETHMDYQPLKEAMAKVEQVVSEINEAKRQAEGLQRILDLQNMIEGVGDLVSAGRYYVKEGELSFYKSPKSKKNDKRHVFFFTDLIVLTHRKGEKKFEHKLSVPLDACTLIVLADSSYIKNAFELSQKQLSKKCILSGESAEESNQWIKEIRALIKGYQKRKLREIEDMKKKGLTPVSS